MVIDKMMINQLAKKYNLRLLLMHGSQVRGRLHTESDIDVAFLAKGKVDLLDIVIDLIRIFGDKVDVTDLSGANPLLLANIMRKCKVLYDSGQMEAEMKSLAFKRYVDYLPYFKGEAEFVANYYGVNENK